MSTPNPQLQKALVLTSKGGALEIQDVPKHKPGPGEILIKIHSAALNPVDYKIRNGAFDIQIYPAVLGSDIAGEVDEIGEGVKEFKKGDRVLGHGQYIRDRAGFQQYALMLACMTTRIPANISYDQASTIPVVLTCAYIGLYNKHPYGLELDAPTTPDTVGKYKGKPIVIFGGASSVGQIAIQLAKLSGFSPIITTASLKNAESIKALGADLILSRDLTSAQILAEVSQATSEPITSVFDAISYPTTQKLGAELLAPGGTIGTVLPPVLSASELEGGKKVVHILGAPRMPHNIELVDSLYHDHLEGWLERGVLKPNNVEVLPGGLEAVQAGFDMLEKGDVSMSKLVVHPQETV